MANNEIPGCYPDRLFDYPYLKVGYFGYLLDYLGYLGGHLGYLAGYLGYV